MHVEVRTTVTATVEETWILKLPAREGRRLVDDPGRFYSLMDRSDVETVNVENTDVYDEQDRRIERVTIIPRPVQ